MLAKAALPSFFFTRELFLSPRFILLLLVTLSVPIIKTIYLLHIEFADGTTAANVGVFGQCYKGGHDATILGISYSGTAACTAPKVGYTLDSTFFGEDNTSRTHTVIVKSLSGALVLNPIAAGLAGLSLVWAFLAWCCASRVLEILTFLTLLLSSLAAWVVFWLDLALVLIASKRVVDYTNNVFNAHIGNAVWIGLAGALCLSFVNCFAGCGIFGRYRSRDRDVVAPNAEKGYKRRWFRKDAPRGTY